jgi:tartrate dehydratase alpha subunit/fumarate hydratase class I-like protein
MTIIRQDDVIRSVADALQYISFYHPVDYIANLARAYEHEQSPASSPHSSVSAWRSSGSPPPRTA